MSPPGLEWTGGALGAALAAVAAGAFVWHARRSPARGGLLALRAAAAASLALAALRPTVALREPRLVKPKLLILIDNGSSMASPAAEAKGPTRLEAASRWLRRASPEIWARAAPEVFALSDRARPVDLLGVEGLRPSEASFQPAQAFGDAASAASPGAERAWLLSDGNGASGPELESALRRLGLPLDVVGVGPSRRGRGLAVTSLKTPDFVFLHDSFPVEAGLEASGLAGTLLKLILLKGQPGGGWTPVARLERRVSSDYEILAATFTASAQALGRESYRLEVAGRLSREFRVEVIRQKYRIMYLSGRPSPEYANLREFLKSDPNHELVSFVILRNPNNAAVAADEELSLIPFPAEDIFVRTLPQFDLFILENFSAARFNLPSSYLQALKGFVSAGGALLVIGGENAFGLGGYRGSPLEDVLPVTLSDQSPDFVPGRFQARPASASHPLISLYESPEASRAIWDGLPPMDGWARFKSVRSDAVVLAVHPREKTASGAPLPVAAIREMGRGKVMLLSSDSTWRWRLGAARDVGSAGFYGRFWTRAVQYLTGSLDLSKVRFAPLPDRIPGREPAVFALRVFDENFRPAPAAVTELSVTWTAPGGRVRSPAARERSPGEYSVELTGLEAGGHRLQAAARLGAKPWGSDQIRFSWEAEAGSAPMDGRWLESVATATSGSRRDLVLARPADLLKKLSPPRETAEVRRRLEPWAGGAWLALTAGLFLLEWALRRLGGHA